MQRTIIIALALVASAVLSYFDKLLPAEAWTAVGAGVLGAAFVPRPGDLTPRQADERIARALEQVEQPAGSVVQLRGR